MNEITPEKTIQLIKEIYKRTLSYELDSVRVNEDGTTTHSHSDRFLDEHPERRNSPEFTEVEELEETEAMYKLAKSFQKLW